MTTTLVPGRDVDAMAEADAYLSDADPAASRGTVAAYKVMCGRVADAAAPVVLELARRLRDSGPVTAADGTVARHVATPSGWTLGVALERVGTPGHVFAVSLEVPYDGSPSVVARLDAESARFRASLEGEGVTGDDLERRVISSRIMSEISLDDEFARSGHPTDLPSPDTVSSVGTFQAAVYAVDAGYAVHGERFEDYAARMRHGTGGGIEGVMSAIGGGRYVQGRLFETTLSSRYGRGDEGYWSPGNVDAHNLVDWADPFSKLSAAVSARGLADAMSAAAAGVGARTYATYASEPDDLNLERIGQALATMDGGLPGDAAVAFAATLEARASAAILGARLPELDALAGALRDGGHGSRASGFEYNDMDNQAWVEDAGEGREILTLTEQNGSYAILIGRDGHGGISTVSAARFGHPVAEYRDHYKDRAWDRIEASEDFHRDHANPSDPLSPLTEDGARAALLAGRTDFPHFIGSFEVVDGRLDSRASGTFCRRTHADVGNLDCCIETGLIEIRESAPAP